MNHNKILNWICVLIEKWYPRILGSLTFIVTIYMNNKININITTGTFDKILDSIINFTSILIGFIGVLIGILFSIKDEVLVVKLFNHKSKEKLKQYFIESFISGIFLILMSIVLYLLIDISALNINYLLSSIWGGLITYTMCCSHRIIRIMILIVFNKSNQNSAAKDSMNIEEKKQLQERHKKG